MAKNDSRRGRGEGALFYRKDRDRWIGRVIINGTSHAISARTKTEARKQLDTLRRTADDGLPIVPGSITVAELLNVWSDKALPNRHLSESRLVGHRWAIAILTEELGYHTLRGLTADHVEAALARRTQPITTSPAKRSGRGGIPRNALSRNSLIKLRSTLNQALSWAQRRNLVARNIATVVELPTTATPSTTGKSLTIEQAQRFLAAAAGTDLEAMWLVLLYLGLRPGEAAGLAWADIDFDNQTIHIWRARTLDHDGAAAIGATKTAGSIRSLDTPTTVLDALTRHRLRQEQLQLIAGSEWANPDGLVFTSPSGKPTDPKGARNEFNRLVAVAGIDGHWTPNMLRHTAASLMADAGMPIEQVADQLGHKDLRMLQQHYRHRIKPTINGANILNQHLNNNDHTAAP